MNVVILAAGRGERFAMVGITVPKPLLEFKGRSLLWHSIRLARSFVAGNGGRVIAVATEPVATVARGLVDYVVPVSVIQPGPAASAHLALAHLPADEPVVVMDCDNYYELFAWTVTAPSRENFVTVADTPSGLSPLDFCGVILAPSGTVARFHEKTCAEPDAVLTGVYGFGSAAELRRCLHATPSDKDVAMSQVMRQANSVKVVRAQGWSPVGTPSQLKVASNG